MTELSGTLEGVGLPAIIRFLAGLQKTGCLRILHDDWQGEIVFEAGQVTGARLGSRVGLSAIDALVETLSGGTFRFDTSASPPVQASIDLPAEALQKHLDELVAHIVGGTPRLPSVDSVPQLIPQDDPGKGEEPLPLDRGTLQTLLAVDGRRTVREIVAHRGSFDALWQLGSLAEVGLVRLSSQLSDSVRASDVAGADASAVAARPTPAEPVVPTMAPEATVERPRVPDAEPEAASGRCPKLGFEDDPANSAGRATRLHRCFAASMPLSLSLDQQRELCLSDQFGTCPRLITVRTSTTRPPFRSSPAARSASGMAAPAIGPSDQSEALPAEPVVDVSRIVRLPFAARYTAAQRGAAGERPAASSSEPTQLRRSTFAQHTDGSSRPTPLRARIERANRAVFTPPEAEPAAAPTLEQPGPERPSFRALLDDSALPRIGGVPVRLIVGGAVALIVLAVLGVLLVPHLGDLLQDDTADLSGLPNASAVAAGTPIAEVAPRPTRVAASAPNGGTNSSAAIATAAAATVLPEATAPAPATAAANVTAAAPAAATPATVPPTSSSPAPAAPLAGAIVLDDRFATNALNWPSDAQGTAWLSNGSYRLSPKQAGQFVAIGAPIANVLRDVVVSATFHKLSGSPDGGGFGVIVRDQGSAPLDGTSQGGQYYVLEVGDKGEVGIWRRDSNQWIDLVPWQHSDAVHTGTATNELIVSAVGNRLSLSVNGSQVVTQTDTTLTRGGVGLLAGGDGNQIAVDRLTVQAL